MHFGNGSIALRTRLVNGSWLKPLYIPGYTGGSYKCYFPDYRWVLQMLLPWLQVGLTNATSLATGASYKCYFPGYRSVLQMLLPWLQAGHTNATSSLQVGITNATSLATGGSYKCHFPGYRCVLQMLLPWLLGLYQIFATYSLRGRIFGRIAIR